MDGDPRATYDRIAEHFASTREFPWPEVEAFVGDASGRFDVVGHALDLGCGNGRHAELLASGARCVVGVDLSRGLLETARERATTRDFSVELVQGDAARLPLDADLFDLAVYVATLHHLRPRRSRVSSLDELARVLAPGGRALVSAWSTAHDRFDRDTGFDTTVDWTLPGGEAVPRYYHIYDPDEFRTDLEQSRLDIVDSFVSSGNCYAVVGSP
ncbi:MAG: class I SAM-dependent methyltransferase [Halobacteriota archaeon]